MLFRVNVNGKTIAVQIVKRGKTVYWRLAPYTLVYPTKRQRDVRNTVMAAAHNNYDKPVDVLLEGVKHAFDDWEYTEKKPNRVETFLKTVYGADAEKVEDYIRFRNNVKKDKNIMKEIDRQVRNIKLDKEEEEYEYIKEAN
jgi:hypothetical protein